MAVIKLELSEYKLLEENKELLQKALEREKELSNEVRKLNQEKIDALKANEKKVTIEKRVISHEHLMVRVPTHQISERLFSIMADVTNHMRIESIGSRHIDRSDIERAFHRNRMMGHSDDWMKHEIDNIQDMFFTRSSRELPSTEEVTHTGLDQVKADIAKEYEESMSKEHKKMIQDYQEILVEIQSHKDEAKEHQIMMKNDKFVIKGLEKDVESLIRKKDLLEEEIKALKACSVPLNFVTLTKEILERYSGLNANSKRVRDLKELWNKQD